MCGTGKLAAAVLEGAHWYKSSWSSLKGTINATKEPIDPRPGSLSMALSGRARLFFFFSHWPLLYQEAYTSLLASSTREQTEGEPQSSSTWKENHITENWSEVKSLSCVCLFATTWTVAYQALLSLGFSRQEYWSRLPFPSPGDLPNPVIKLESPVLQADALPSEPP